jgi:dolichyl-diphosphooligosaccharide--protein glycosyltransferase
MDGRDVRVLLDERPDLEDALREVRSVDADRETWSFEDVPVDSGAFGELVGEGVVESVGDDYRVADPDAVDRALAGDVAEPSADDEGFDLSLPAVDRNAALALVGLVALTVVFRASTYPSVFRDRVVFSGNDPYFYVFFVEQSLAGGWSPGELPGGLADGEPLTFLVMVLAGELAGGLGDHRAVLAWLPVVAAVATMLALYGFACEVSGDRRVALASVFVLATLPIHVLRSSLGFVDHHAVDYFWLVLAAWGLVATLEVGSLAVDRRTVRAVALLAVGVAGSVLAWWAATLLLFPVAIAVVAAGAMAVRDDERFLAPGVATAVGLGAGTAVVVLAHVAGGWQKPVVVGVPVAATVGVVGVVGATHCWRRAGWPAWGVPAAGVVGVGAAAAVLSVAAPEAWGRVASQVARLFAAREIVEMQSLFGASTMGWLVLFGLLLLVAIPAMLWGAYRASRGDRRWLVASSYAWFLLALATVQSRYAGEFSPFAALFGGFGLLVLAERVDAAGRPVPLGGDARGLSIPDRDVAFRLAFVVLLVCGLSAVLAPISANNVAIPEEQYETAAFVDGHAAEADYEYPRSYVFSPWSWNRMYNYHVSGNARSYAYAQNLYRPFTQMQSPEAAYQMIRAGRAGDAYLVTEPVPGEPDIPAASMQSRLHDRLGSRGDGVEGLAHYRALYVSSSGDYKAFRVVPGATIRGDAEPGTTVTVRTDVEVSGHTFTYERRTTAGADGRFRVTVSYPGEYELEGAAGDSVTVEESIIGNGGNVTVD